MAQTLEQRKRNERFAKQLNSRRGKRSLETKTKQDSKSPLSPLLAGLLTFIIFGGFTFELMYRIFI